MANKRVKLSPPDTFHQFLDLPLHDLMVPGISKFMKLKDILNLRCCSRYCKELGEPAIATQRRIVMNSRKLSSKAFFRVVSQHCRNLRQIALTSQLWLTDEMIIPVFNKNPHLEFVSLYGCKSLTAEALYPLPGNCKKLTGLKLVGVECDDRFLELLNEHEIQLELIVLTKSRGFTGKGVCSFLSKQPRLEEIFLPLLGHRSIFTRTLETIAATCKELRQLSIEKYHESYDEVLIRVLKDMTKLERLIIGKKQAQEISCDLGCFLSVDMKVYKHRDMGDCESFSFITDDM